jgi:hypothetical protein
VRRKIEFLKQIIVFASLIFVLIPSNTAIGTSVQTEHLAQAQFTTAIRDKMPVNDITELSSDFKKAYFFTDIRDCKKCKVKHEWWYQGKNVSTIKAKVKFDRYRWWTSKTLNDNMLGDWTVKVILDNRVIYTKTFSYYKPTVIQQQVAPVQQRLQLKTIDECEIQLRYFSDKLKENPDDAYFKFMNNKWGKRCNE